MRTNKAGVATINSYASHPCLLKNLNVVFYPRAGFTVDRHTHPGVETGYILQGEADFMVEGQPDKRLKAGDHFNIAGLPHSVRAGPATKVVVTYVVDKTKPLASPAPR